MKKKLILAFFLSTAVGLKAQNTIVGATEPMTYAKKDGRLKIHSYIKLNTKDFKGLLKAKLDGNDLKLQKTDVSDSLLVWLPMIGEKNVLEVYAGNKKLADQVLTPLIPADWGYFQRGTIHIIQSSHQDIGWMDTPDYCRKDRINETIIPALEIMKKDADFTFEMEQTLNLMEFLDEHPERKDEIIQRYKEKRFTWGATYNQPYEGLSSGEQLVRQSYYGRKWIRENLPGCDDRTANNIDVPGRSMQMPQILAKSGIHNLFVSRMKEGLYDWTSPDGSKVLTFTPGNYGWASLKWKFFEKDAVTAFGKLHHRSLLWSDYFKKHNIPAHYAILMSCDATKPTNYRKIIEKWNSIVQLAEIPLPALAGSTAEQYFELVNTKDSDFEKVHGERPDLWLYIHGPAHYEATLYKRDAAILLPAAESFTTINSLLDNSLNSYPRKSFDRAWMASIYPDHGLGGKNGDITDRVFQDSLKLSRDMGQSLLQHSLVSIANKVNASANDVVVFNDLTWNRTELARVEVASSDMTLKDENGRGISSQIIKENGKLMLVFMAENVPSMGYCTYRLAKGKSKSEQPGEIAAKDNAYENKYYKVLLGNGGVQSLFDKELNKELLHTSKFKGGDIIEAGYTGNGAGEFTKITELTPGDISAVSEWKSNWKLAENGSLFAVYENIQPTKNATIIQRIKLYHSLKKIDFDVTLQNFNGEHNRQYRIAFPLNMGENTIHYEVPMGVLQVGKDEMKTIPGGWAWGGTYSNHPADTHPREIQNFMSASGNGFGLTMSSCVAVGDWVDPSREQADYPILQGILLSSHKSCHGEGNWYHQTGTHHFRFSVSSHPEGWKNGYQFGIAANHPLFVVKKETKGGELAKQQSFLSVSDPLVALSLIKKADEDNHLIIRLTEMEGKDKKVTLKLPLAAKRVIKTNLIEEEERVLTTSGEVITLDLPHHSIETYKIEL